MHKHIKIFVATVLTLGTMLSAQDAAKQQLQKVAANYEKWLKRDFRANVKCKEINKVIETAINAQAKKAAAQFGIQAPKINLGYFQFDVKGSKTVVKAKLAPGTPMKEQMEAEANKMLMGSPLGKTLESIAFDSVRQGVEFLKKGNLTFDVRKDDAQQMTVVITGIQDKILGKSIKNVAIKVDKKNDLLSIVRANIDGGGYIMSEFKHGGVKTPEGGSVPVIQATQITQKGLDAAAKGVSLPPKFIIQYGGYKIGAVRSN